MTFGPLKRLKIYGLFFNEVLAALRINDDARAINLMSHLSEPKETFLGVSSGDPQGRGVGLGQARQLISAIKDSVAYKTGLLSDLSEMSLYVEGIDRDKISDLTTNIIRNLLVEYTQEQCDLHGIETLDYNGPAFWDRNRKNWIAQHTKLPFIGNDAIILVPKYIVRRRLSMDSQEFYNKQITDFLIDEHLKANSSLVQTLKNGKKKVYKGDVREEKPKSKSLIADMVRDHPELLDLLKEVAKRQGVVVSFQEDEETVQSVCKKLIDLLPRIPTGRNHANDYHNFITGALTAIFYPDLITPKKEWEIHDGRKRIDVVFTNAANTGFFSHRRNESSINANVVIVECKNYSTDIANPELDQLIARFNRDRGRLGIIACRAVDNPDLLKRRCQDAIRGGQGCLITLTDEDVLALLLAKSEFRENDISTILHTKYRDLLA